MARVALPWRLPNPPSPFVGRVKELAWLRRTLKAQPLAVIHGAEGCGKSALAAAALRKRRPESILCIPSAGEREPLTLRATRALVAAHALTSFDWASALLEPQALLAVALELAERGQYVLVLEDLQATPPAELRALLTAVGAHAREARWLALTRGAAPLPPGAAPALELKALPAPQLARLARALAPKLKPGQRLLATRAAGGSPRRLRLALAAVGAGFAPNEQQLLAGASPELLEVLGLLAACELPISAQALRRALPRRAAPLLDEAVRRGWAEPAAGGLRLAEPLRPLFEAEGPSQPLRERSLALAPSLLEGTAREALQGLSLLAAHGEAAGLQDALERRGAELLRLGHAGALDALLRDRDEPALTLWRLRCATQLGGAAPAPPATPLRTDEERLEWARAELAAKRFAAALEHANALARRAPLRAEAALVAARALAGLGQWQAAVERLEGLPPLEGGRAVLVHALGAVFRMMLGRAEEALASAALARGALAAADEDSLAEVGHALTTVYARLATREEALRVVDEVLRRARRGAVTPYTYGGRRLLFFRASLLLELGHLAEGEQAMRELEPFFHAAAGGKVHIQLALCEVALWAGEPARALELWREAEESLLADERPELRWGVRAVGHTLACADAALPPPEPLPVPERLSVVTAFYVAAATELGLRRGTVAPRQARATLEALAPFRDAELLAQRVRGVASLVEGELPRALEELREAALACERAHLTFRTAECWLLEADALLASGNYERAAATAQRLLGLAKSAPSPRLAEAGRLAALAARGPLAPAALVPFAQGGADAATARRARALLGGDEPLDAVDARVVAALAARRGTGFAWSGAQAAPWAAWGLDTGERTASLPGGARISFASRPLFWRILACIAEGGGVASKEQIVRRAWELPDYHPLRDDNRLQVAMRRLRAELEEDPKAPRRLVTLPDGGYGFGERAWITGAR